MTTTASTIKPAGVWLLTALLLLLFLPAYGAPAVKTLKGTATYYAAPEESTAEARRKAREMAIYEAIREAFGSVMSHTVKQEDISDSSGEFTRLYTNSSFELKGEWVSDIRNEYVTDYRDDALVVTCTSEFRAREVTNQAPPIDCSILLTPDLRSRTTEIPSGEHLYASFCSPTTDGYLTICLSDENGRVNRLLPSRSSSTQTLNVKKGFDYIFFDTGRQSPDGSRVFPLTLSIPEGEKLEINTVYFIFSPNAYSDGPWHRGATRREPPYMSVNEFNNWLHVMASRDPAVAYKVVPVTIRGKATNTEEIKY